MSERVSAADTTEQAALTALVVNCPELAELEDRLGGFNLFDTLGAANAELRHSHTLAWLLDPAQDHGLDDLFLQNWLIRIVHAADGVERPPLSPVEIDTWNLAAVEVRREWRSIDLLVLLTHVDGAQWVVCIENKVGSMQHSDQLRRYRETIETEFPKAAKQLFIFLTRDDEDPEDDAFISADYSQVTEALRDALQRRRNSIGAEPRLLMESYLRLLEERFMNDSEIARLARSIYRKHHRAIDVILEHRPDEREAASEALQTSARQSKGVLPVASTKSSFRFLPTEWDVPKNRAGTAWGPNGAFVLFEVAIPIRGRTSLRIIAGRPPYAWYQRILSRIGEKPFASKPRTPKTNPQWITIESLPTGVHFDLDSDEGTEEQAKQLWKKIANMLAKPDIQERIAVIRELIEELPEPET
ncbi:MAG: PD-(D/E)XK nuclease family protein [Opitutaceae bacterium]